MRINLAQNQDVKNKVNQKTRLINEYILNQHSDNNSIVINQSTKY